MNNAEGNSGRLDMSKVGNLARTDRERATANASVDIQNIFTAQAMVSNRQNQALQPIISQGLR
jgi:hypothetical protein